MIRSPNTVWIRTPNPDQIPEISFRNTVCRYKTSTLLFNSLAHISGSDLNENFTTNVPLDKEVPVKFWKSSGWSRVQIQSGYGLLIRTRFASVEICALGALLLNDRSIDRLTDWSIDWLTDWFDWLAAGDWNVSVETQGSSGGGGGGKLTVDVSLNGRSIPAKIEPEADNRYHVSFTPIGSGVYTVKVYYAGVEVTGNTLR